MLLISIAEQGCVNWTIQVTYFVRSLQFALYSFFYSCDFVEALLINTSNERAGKKHVLAKLVASLDPIVGSQVVVLPIKCDQKIQELSLAGLDNTAGFADRLDLSLTREVWFVSSVGRGSRLLSCVLCPLHLRSFLNFVLRHWNAAIATFERITQNSLGIPIHFWVEVFVNLDI